MDTLNFENLRVYQKGVEYVDELYQETKNWSKEHLYSLTDQLRRAGLSIVLNIAEGSSRTKKEYRHFLDLSRGSCYESIACWEIVLRQEIVRPHVHNKFRQYLVDLTKMISGLKRSLI